MSWKTSFFIIALVNVLVVIGAVVMLLSSSSSVTIKGTKINETKYAKLDVQTTKADVNVLIDEYVKEHTKDQPLTYDVKLDNDVVVATQVPIFGKKLDAVVTFEPVIADNGNVELTNAEVTIGKLKVPIQYVLKYIKDNAPLPNWVVVNTDKQTIYVALTEYTTKTGYRVKANKLDLKNDRLSLTLFVPVKQIIKK